MSSLSATPDSNPTRAQLRLVVLGQWVRAGLGLARSAKAGRGLVGGTVALWRIFQAVRLAILLYQRLSELRGVLSSAASETAPREAEALARASDDPPCNAAFLRQALIELARTIRDALGHGLDGFARSGVEKAVGAAAALEVPHALGRLKPPRGRPPDRPPGPERSRARRRRPCATGAWKPTLPPIAAPAVGRYRLAAG